jgi:hypothetical protein
MRSIHQTLKLQHHRHTGKLLHHRHTSYRALAVVFVVAGVFILGLNVVNKAAADTFGISAIVNVPVPSSAPIITAPSASAQISSSSVLVVGSCPLITPQVVVDISIDGSEAGTGVCDSRNDFSVPVPISSGSHQIIATALTISGQKGPSGSPLSVNGTALPQSTITFSTDSPFIYAADKTVTWAGTIDGVNSTNEYVHIDWGDNNQSNYTVQAGAQTFSHYYSSLASHNVLLAVSNSSGQTYSRQFAEAGFTAATFPQPAAPTLPYSNSRAIVGLYGLYLSALSVTVLVWLEAKHSAWAHARNHVLA